MSTPGPLPLASHAPLNGARDGGGPIIAPPSEAHAQLVRERLLRQLFALGRTTQWGAVATALLAEGLFYAMTPRPAVIAWALLMHGAQATRWFFLWQNERRYPRARFELGQPAGAWRYVLPLTGAALAWAAAPWLLLPLENASTTHSALLTVIIFGMLAGSIPAVAPWPTAMAIWLSLVTLGLASRFAWQGDATGWILCVSVLLFGGVMARFALDHHRLLRNGLSAQIEKEALSERLMAQSDQLMAQSDLLMAQSQDLQRLNQERSRFFASASHDLRQPVHALALFSRALERDLAGHALAPVASRVVQATDAVSGLLNAMLDISKIDAGTVVPQPTEIAVDPLFLRVSQLFESRAQEAGLGLRFHTAPEWLHTDSELMLRVIANFVDNALKYTQRGGILVSARPRGERLRIAVWDTGPGIAPAHMRHVFDEFYQVDNPQRDVARGLGIGLAIVKRLAELLGGEVGVRSRVGRGSVFWIEVPRPWSGSAALPPPAGHPAPAAAPPPPQRPMAPPRVLLLDDELPVGEALRMWLAPHCARIEVTRRLAEARAQVRADPEGFDAFIVDFRLADPQDGIAATAELRQLAGRAVPTILVTGDTDPARVRAAYASGLVVMFKPVQPETLLHTLHHIIAGAGWRTGS